MAYKKLPDGRWIVYYWTRKPGSGRKHMREYFGRGPQGEAAARKRNDELALRRTSPTRTKTGPAFAELAKAYLAGRGLNANSHINAVIRLESWILPLIGHRVATHLDDNDMDGFVAALRGAGLTNSSIRRYLTDIKAILTWATKRRPPMIAFNPVRDYRKPDADDAIIMPPSAAEIAAILEAVAKPNQEHLRRFVGLCCNLGARPGHAEILTLTWRQVSWSACSVRVISAQKGGPRSRQVPIREDFQQVLRAWWDDDRARYGKDKAEALSIVHYFGRPVHSIKKAWSSAKQSAGIRRRLRPYDLRHWYVTNALERGADPKALSEIVGSRPETLQRHYQHVTRKLHRETVNLMPEINLQRMAKRKG